MPPRKWIANFSIVPSQKDQTNPTKKILLIFSLGILLAKLSNS